MRVGIPVISGTWKTVEEIRIAVQWNLDRNFDGEITKAEADEFLELLRMGMVRSGVVRALLFE